MSVAAVVLMTVERAQINEVAQQIADLPGVSDVFSVAGRYDVVALVRVADNEAMAALVTEQILAIPHILGSETLLAFRSFSRRDMEAMFEVGFDEG